MLGTVESVHSTFGFIRGEDSVSRFFLPSAIQHTSPVQFDGVAVGHRVEFVHIDHPRGPRAIEVRVLNQSQPYSRLTNGDQA